MKLDATQQKFIFYTVGGILVYQIAVKPLLEATGLKDTKEEADLKKLKLEAENLPANQNYWAPSYYKQIVGGMKATIFTVASADRLCKELKDAKGFFNDNEEQIYSVFRACKFKTQISFLVERFRFLYKLDLYTWLRDSVLNEKELSTVLNITSKLPTGFNIR
jgi:hypothetical protein